MSYLPYQGALSNLWGYYDSINNKEYALVGVQYGLSIVDITNPANPVELFFIPGDTSLWQEPKTWKHFAYMTNETGKKGLMIVDLKNLPVSVNYVFWKDSTLYKAGRSHTCFIDENGFLYLNGSQVTGGTMIFDLKPDPFNPKYLGNYNDFYVHDCFVRNDTLWTAEILDGNVTVVDVKNKNAPTVMARFQTPFYFTHNCWLSADGKTLYTTDEKPFATVAAYDVSDLNNITLLDEYRHSYFDDLIPHNVYVTDDSFLHVSYYRAGVTIVDAHRSDNLVEIAHYDTSPFPDGDGFQGCWGVYPFLPSGNIIASDMEEGLFVLKPLYKRACYLEGQVASHNGNNLAGIEVNILGDKAVKQTNYFGEYKTGTANNGKYDVRFYDPVGRCQTKIVSGVLLKEGMVTKLNVTLNCPLSTGDDLINNLNLKIAPNPFSNFALLETTHSIKLVVNDLSGKTILDEELDSGHYNIGNDWPSGIYMAKVISDKNLFVLKIIKE
ncbi:MAG: choice-of-anchor B family protein [Chitinophagales bacterium]|nr:choice-of-anchor B family protein [Chitinophagales bacterium]MDW8274378.1 choice-of-anchor B family protein [Chitinophagales bacterium]